MSDGGLTEFLLARITEEEGVAADMRTQAVMGRPLLQLLGGGTGIRDRVDPARWLAECEAKRRIVKTLERWTEVAGRTAEESADDAWIAQAQVDALEPVIATLALPYADHPDFRPEWAV